MLHICTSEINLFIYGIWAQGGIFLLIGIYFKSYDFAQLPRPLSLVALIPSRTSQALISTARGIRQPLPTITSTHRRPIRSAIDLQLWLQYTHVENLRAVYQRHDCSSAVS